MEQSENYQEESEDSLVSQRKHVRMKKDAINKRIFRAMRSSFMREFDNSEFSRGKHHWDEERWVLQINRFMLKVGLDNTSELNVFKTMVLVSSTKISKKTPKQFLKFIATIRNSFSRMFEKANISDIKHFLADPFGRMIFDRFVDNG